MRTTLICHQVTAVHEVMHTMKTNLANIKNVLHAWGRPLMERKPKPVDRDEFERAHKAIKSSRYSEIREGGKVRLPERCSVRIIVQVLYFVHRPVKHQTWKTRPQERLRDFVYNVVSGCGCTQCHFRGCLP